jgi:hypothetical protein
VNEPVGLPPFSGKVTTPPEATAPATTPVAAGIHESSTAKPASESDSASASSKDQIIAAAKPNFQNDVPVTTGDLDLGTDLSPAANSAAVAPSELARRLEAAEKQAQQDLTGRLASFHAVIPASRLGSSDGVSQAKSAWNAGADAIHQYRARIARLEQAYEDSVLASQRAQRWSGPEMRGWAAHQSPAEATETSQMVDLMLSQVNEALDLLAATDGQYEIKGGTVRFKNPASGTRYLSVRTWVEQRMQSWSATPEAARPRTVSLLLKALGDGLPAVE